MSDLLRGVATRMPHATRRDADVVRRLRDRLGAHSMLGTEKDGAAGVPGEPSLADWLQRLRDDLLDAAACVERLAREIGEDDRKPDGPPGPSLP